MHKNSYVFIYKGGEIGYDIWFSGPKDQISTIVFLGTVQVGDIPRWVAQACPSRTAVVQGAPHWFAESDGSDIPEFMLRFTEDAYRRIKHKCDVDDIKIISDSQAAPPILRMLCSENLADTVSAVILLQPLGLNRQAYGDGDDSARLRIFKKRLFRNALNHIAPMLYDERLRYSYRQQLRLTFSDGTKADAQYAAGLGCDSTGDLLRVYASGIRVSIVCGARDELFPPEEISRNLKSREIPIQVRIVAGVSHSPLPSRQGLHLLRVALGQ